MKKEKVGDHLSSQTECISRSQLTSLQRRGLNAAQEKANYKDEKETKEGQNK